MANTLTATLLQNDPVVQPTKVVVEVNFPTSAQAIAYTAGGDTVLIDAADILDPSLLGAAGPNEILPIYVSPIVQGADGSNAEWIPGTTLKNGKLRLWDANGTEFSGNYGTPWLTGVVLLVILLATDDR